MESPYPPQPAEGRLIEEAVKADGRSVRQLAPLAGISDARWRHIVKGYQPTGGGRWNEAKAPAQTLARMAYLLGIDPDELDAAGRPDAAQALAGVQAARERHPQPPTPATISPAAGPASGDEIDMVYRSQSMTAEEKLEAIRKVLHLRAQADAASGHAEAFDATMETRPPVKNGN